MAPPTADDDVEFLRALQSSIQIFVNRMRSDHSRGRSIANDSAVQGLFMTISQMHPQLLKCVHEQEELRSEYVLLLDMMERSFRVNTLFGVLSGKLEGVGRERGGGRAYL